MPILLTSPPLEQVLRGLHDSEILCGIQDDLPTGRISAWIDFGSYIKMATLTGSNVGDQQVGPVADRMASWLHETALRIFPDSPYAKSHGN